MAGDLVFFAIVGSVSHVGIGGGEIAPKTGDVAKYEIYSGNFYWIPKNKYIKDIGGKYNKKKQI